MSTKRRAEKTDDIPVPDISQDAAERKRVLNILAQRRYRKKKRERLAALEAQAKSSSSSAKSSVSEEDPGKNTEVPVKEKTGLTTAPLRTADVNLGSSEATFQLNEDPFDFSPNHEEAIDSNILSSSNIDDLLPPGLTSGSSNSSNSPILPNDLDNFLNQPVNSQSELYNPFQFFENPESNGTGNDLASTLQDHQSSTFTFPDDHLIDVPSLTLLRASLTVASRLGVAERLWDFTCVSPFYTGPLSTSTTATDIPPDLPLHLHPTPTQRLIPHHPLLDLLPWPTVRDKMIQVFSVPAHLRPPSAADPMALLNFVYDMEDPAEGMRVGGQDPFEPGGWEVGQVVFEKWWWAFDGKVVERSNWLRKQRGQQGLVLGVVG